MMNQTRNNVRAGGQMTNQTRRDVRGCNVQLADEIMLISIIYLIFRFAHAPVLSNLIYTKHAQ